MSDDTFQQIGFEQGIQPGFSACWSGMNGAGAGVAGSPPDGHGQNFFMIPTGKRVTRLYGTSTIKVSGIELLFRIVSGMGDDCDTLLQEHHIVPRLSGQQEHTLQIDVNELPVNAHLTGDGYKAVWVEWQAINSMGAYTGPGGAFEFQLNFVLA